MNRFWIAAVLFTFVHVSGALADQQQTEAIKFLSAWTDQVKGLAPGPAVNPELPPIKCGTPAFLAASAYANRFAKADLALFTARPVLPFSYATDHFVIHYATSGPDSVYQPSVDSIAGIPVHVTRTASVFENVWATETGTLGYRTPPPDFGNGGDNRYDVYLVNLGAGYFGFTAPESTILGYRATSFIELENDFAESSLYRTHPLDAVKVTAAHEFFHSIQFNYDEFEFEAVNPNDPSTYKPWWQEASSTWMEDIVYPDINDFLGYLPFFYGNMWMSVTTFSSTGARAFHPYASCVWPIYMTERFADLSIMRDIWEECGAIAGYNTLPSTNDALIARGSGLQSAFLEFEIWNFHTGQRADSRRFYRDGATYPVADTTAFITNLNSIPSFSLSGLPQPPEDMATNYIIVQPNPVPGGVAVNFAGTPVVDLGWHVAFLGYIPGSSFWTDIGVNPSNGVGQGTWSNWNLNNAVVLVPTVSGLASSDTLTNFYSGSLVFDSTLSFENDVAVAGVISPGGSIRKGEAITPIIRYANMGRASASFTAHLVISRGSETYDNTVAVNALAPAQSEDVTFPNFTPNDVGDYSLVATSIFPGDQSPVNDTLRITLTVVGGVGQILAAYPSPFIIKVDGDVLTIPYSFDAAFQTQGSLLRVYDVSGNLVSEVAGDFFRSGSGDLVFGFKWDGKNDNNEFVASGIYIYHLETAAGNARGKIAVVNDIR